MKLAAAFPIPTIPILIVIFYTFQNDYFIFVIIQFSSSFVNF